MITLILLICIGGIMFDRIVKLIGKDKFHLIQSKTVAVVGLGGVGGYAVEGLIRSGIQNIIIVDYDKIDITNLNRQLITNTKNIGKYKTDIMEEHIKFINPNCTVTKLQLKLDLDNLNTLFDYKFDYLIDACDTVVIKEELIKRCLTNHIKIISSMGTGNKLNPSLLEIIDIRKTEYDPLAKKIRKYVKTNHIKGEIPVVCSKEQNPKFEGSIPSLIFVPATSGLLCSNYVIKDIIKETNENLRKTIEK